MKTICIVGCGNIAKTHAKNLQKKAKLSFASRRLESAQHFEKAFGGIKSYSSYEEALQDRQVDAVILCTPPEWHKDQILQALDAKKSILVEKPMVISRQELFEVEEKIKHHPELVLMVAENYPYKPLFAKLQNIIASKRYGKVTHVAFKKMFMQKSQSWKSSYGALFEGGIHFVSMMTGLLGTPISVQASFPKASDPNKPERTSHLELTFDMDLKATLDYSWETPHLLFGVFQQSSLAFDQQRIIFESNGLFIKAKDAWIVPNLLDLGGNKAMMKDFLDCLENPRTKPKYGVIEVKRDLEVVWQAYEKNGQKVRV